MAKNSHEKIGQNDQIHRTAGSVAGVRGGSTFWQYNFDPTYGKPYFHPLCAADGTILTDLRPTDHPWHRGFWWSWKYLNGKNYWEEDPATGRSEGATELRETKVDAGTDNQTLIQQELGYRSPDGELLIAEDRTIRVSGLTENGDFSIDWRATFTGVAEVVQLDRTPPERAGGAWWGGYAGLSLRRSQPTAQWVYGDSENRNHCAIHGNKAQWVRCSGQTPSGNAVTITIFGHPQNPTHPSNWYTTSDDLPFFGPSPLFEKPIELRAGQTIRFAYMLTITNARTDGALERQVWKEFSKTS